jgi:hypothetical protein
VVLEQKIANVDVDQVRGAGRGDRAENGRQDVLKVPQRSGREQKKAPYHVSGDWHDLRAFPSGVPRYRAVPPTELALVKKERLAPAYMLILDGVKVSPDCRCREIGRDQKRQKRRE